MANLDTVRTMIGDTDDSDELLTDAEITTFIDQRSYLDNSGGTVTVNLPAAAADCASAIAGKYARQFDFSEDSQSFSRAQRVGHYVQLERELRNRSGGIVTALGGTLLT